MTMFTDLRNPGFVGAAIVCCDGVKVLPEVMRVTWPEATVQRHSSAVRAFVVVAGALSLSARSEPDDGAGVRTLLEREGPRDYATHCVIWPTGQPSEPSATS